MSQDPPSLSSAPEQANYCATTVQTQFSLRGLMVIVTVVCALVTWLFVMAEFTAMLVLVAVAFGYALLVIARLPGRPLYRATVAFLAVLGMMSVGTFLWTLTHWRRDSTDAVGLPGPPVALLLSPAVALVAALLFRGLIYLLNSRRTLIEPDYNSLSPDHTGPDGE